MEQLWEVRTRILLEKSADLQNRMAEIWALRKAVRTSEATTVSDAGSRMRKSALIGHSAN